MKRSHIKILLLEILAIVILIINTFILNKLTKISLIIFLCILSLIIILLLGYEKPRKRFEGEFLYYIFVYSITLYIVEYVIGYFIGFDKSVYILNKETFISKILPTLGIIISTEFARYCINKKADGSKLAIFLSFILFTFVSITISFSYYNLDTLSNAFKLFASLLLPALASNGLLTYISIKNAYKPAIFYRLIWELPIYILPIFPGFGIYIQSMIDLLFPTILFLKLQSMYIKDTFPIVEKRAKFWNIGFLFSLIFFFIIIYLVSGLFHYYALVIGSGSMTPNINKGDAIIVERVNNFDDIEVGDVLVFQTDTKVVCHRVIEIKRTQGRFYYVTKGDNNNAADSHLVSESEVKGTANFRIRYIGIPTVALNEFFSNK